MKENVLVASILTEVIMYSDHAKKVEHEEALGAILTFFVRNQWKVKDLKDQTALLAENTNE